MGLFGDLLTAGALHIADQLLNDDDSSNYNEDQNKNITQYDVMKWYTYVLGYNCEISKDTKKILASLMRKIFNDDSISAFVLEDYFKLSESYNKKSSKKIFDDYGFMQDEKPKMQELFLYTCILIISLISDRLVLPQQIYNFYVLKNTCNFTRSELNSIYNQIANFTQTDIDEISESLKELLSENGINEIKEKYPEIGDEKARESVGTNLLIDSDNQTENLLKFYTFIVGYHYELSKYSKKLLVTFINETYDTSLSVFECEDNFESYIELMKDKSLKEAFYSLFTEKLDDNVYAKMYANTFILIMALIDDDTDNSLSAQCKYNLYALSKILNLNKSILATEYKILAEILETDIDNIAESFEEFLNQDTINQLLGQFPEVGEYGDDRRAKLAEIKKMEQIIAQKNAEDKKAAEARIIETIKNTWHSFIDKKSEIKNQFYYLDENSKVVSNAIQSYAKGSSGENALFQWDDSFLGNGKVGFLLTNKNIYFRNSFSNPDLVPLKDIDSFGIKGNVIIANGKTIFVTSQTDSVREFLNEILPLVKQL